MSTLRFTDGIKFDTSGPLRIAYRRDGVYVVGEGMLCPVSDEDEAHKLIENIRKSQDKK